MLSNEEMIIRLVLAATLGSLIGWERERLSWSAGLRTHMLVCVGACLIMIVSAFGFADILGTKDVVLDPMLVKRGEMTIDLLQQTTGAQTLRIKQFIIKPSESPDHDDVSIAFARIPQKEVVAMVECLSKLSCVSEVKEVKFAG